MTDLGRQRLRRAAPVAAMAAIAFVIGAIVGSGHGGSEDAEVAKSFAADWARGDYLGMYAQIDAAARRSVTPAQFAADYEDDQTTATETALSVDGPPRAGAGGAELIPVAVRTRLFGTLRMDYALTVAGGPEGDRVQWTASTAFPGLAAGERLTRRIIMPTRATIYARDGSVLAEGSPAPAAGEQPSEVTRTSPLGSIADGVLGAVGPAPAERRAALEAQGVPPDAYVGLSGVERALDNELRGRPGGELLAGGRVIAYAAPRAAAAVHSTVSPELQNAAVAALGGQYGAVVAMNPQSGQVYAVAGIGLDGLQPPGSTFKMVTVTSVLTAGVANPHTVFPYSTYATLDGVKLSNANGEECGGSLELAFAVSCNSVFAPLAVKVGAPRLVQTAEAFGFNHPSSIEGAAESTLPQASRIQGELDLGSTGIGQAEVLATPLEMATVAATVADGGRRPSPTFQLASTSPQAVAMSPSVAHTVRHLMIAVVREGTGRSAAIPGVVVAGKTGTAELKSACTTAPASSEPSSTGEPAEAKKEPCQAGETEASNTDAWFAAFAPAYRPKIVVCVMLVKDGAGGTTAAPIAREVIEAALHEGL